MKTQSYEERHIHAFKATNIIAQLQRDILPLQGYKNLSQSINGTIGFRPIELSFPNAIFPTGCVHEFLSTSTEDVVATNGFAVALLTRLIKNNGVCIWISASRTIFPLGLKRFGIEPHQIIFIDLKKEEDVLWTI